jgi:hypothetical protein
MLHAQWRQQSWRSWGVMRGDLDNIWAQMMAAIGRESVEVQILIWLVVALGIAIFVEGLRATFFLKRVHAFEEPAPRSPPRIKSVRIASHPRMWQVTVVARDAGGAPDLVAVISKLARNPRRRVDTLRRRAATCPQIHRRPMLVLPREPAFTMEMQPEPEQAGVANSDLRLASAEA